MSCNCWQVSDEFGACDWCREQSEDEPRHVKKLTTDIDGKFVVFEITESEHANEWSGGDPVPTDKETLGYVHRLGNNG